MSLKSHCVCVTLPVVTVILLHQGGMWPEHQLYFAGTTIDHRVPAPILSSVIHVQTAVITCLGALNARTCLLGRNVQTPHQEERCAFEVSSIIQACLYSHPVVLLTFKAVCVTKLHQFFQSITITLTGLHDQTITPSVTKYFH